MLLDCDREALIEYLENKNKLRKRIEEAYQVNLFIKRYLKF